jgi:CspA family cold shock protein
MARGVIKFYSEPRGYGYILSEGDRDLRAEVFVHYSQILGSGAPMEGQAVTFEVKQGARGPEAINVRLLP